MRNAFQEQGRDRTYRGQNDNRVLCFLFLMRIGHQTVRFFRSDTCGRTRLAVQ
jgi:hypothetical protein